MKNNSRFGGNKLRPADTSLKFERVSNRRVEKEVAEELQKIVFSLKDFDIKQIPPGQAYSAWETDGLLAEMMHKFQHVCSLNVVEAQQQKVLKIYGSFPQNTKFKHPPHIDGQVRWAVIMDIKGQKARVAGHMIGHVFFVVFLDKDHLFYISEKKNT